MNTEKIQAKVRSALAVSFPNSTLVFDANPGGFNDIGVGVYGVSREDVRQVEDMILDLDWELCAGNGCVLTPRVRDMETTRRFYPHLLPRWKVAVAEDPDQMEFLVQPAIREWVNKWPVNNAGLSTTNGDLALAA